MLKKSIIALSLIGLMGAGIAPVFAQSVSPVATVTGSAKSGLLANVIAKGDGYITQRLTTLNGNLTQINDAKRLSADAKTAFTTNVNTDISGLTTLKAKIDADTDLPTAREDVKSIFTTYRVYALFDPQTHLLVAADTMTTTSDMLNDFADKLESRINQASASGSVANLQTLLADMRAKITDAKTQYGNVETQVSTIKAIGL